MSVKFFQAAILSIALFGLVAPPADAYYSARAKAGAEIRIHGNNQSRVKGTANAGAWLIFSRCTRHWCELSDRNLYWGWIKKKHLKNLKVCPEAVCGDGGGGFLLSPWLD